jgi:hypothetical protein
MPKTFDDGLGRIPVYVIPEPDYPQNDFLGRLTQFLADECKKKNIKSFLILGEKDNLESTIGIMSYIPNRKECSISLRGRAGQMGTFTFYNNYVEMAHQTLGAFLCHELNMALEGFTCCKNYPSKAAH